jgi:hypothetical protein
MKHLNALMLLMVVTLALSITFCNRGVSTAATDQNKGKEMDRELKKIDKEKSAVKSTEPAESEKVNSSGPPMRNFYGSDPDTVIMMKKTSCYGDCPVYQVSILSNGTLSYHGKRNVERKGHFSASISLSKIRKIDQRMDNISILNMANHYPEEGEDILDISNIILLTQFKSKKKEIFINHGAPEELMNFVSYIEQIVESVDWKIAHPKH